MTKRVIRSRIALFAFLAFLQGTFPFLLPRSLRPAGYGTLTTVPSRHFEYDRAQETPGSGNERPVSYASQSSEDVIELTPRCRIVTRSGSCIPADPSILPANISEKPYLLDKLDTYYHAKARKVEQDLSALEANERALIEGVPPAQPIRSRVGTDQEIEMNAPIGNETQREIPALRQALEDSGFELLSQRDIDLCECLNAGYLLRLSLLPDVRELDPIISKEFFPERFNSNGTLKAGYDELLFGGRVLVYWRGYSQEVTKGRLILPKLNYLQANLVKRAAAWVKNQLDRFESSLLLSVQKKSRQLRRSFRSSMIQLSSTLQIPQFRQWIGSMFSDGYLPESQLSMADPDDFNDDDDLPSAGTRGRSNTGKIVLNRYGGSKTLSVEPPDPLDALGPFTVCEIDYNDFERMNGTNSSSDPNGTIYSRAMNASFVSLNGTEYSNAMNSSMGFNDTMYNGGSEGAFRSNTITCAYDEEMTGKELPRMQLLERVSIGSLIDLFNKVGRRGLLKTIVAKSELVEPTYEEVVVVWRPIVKSKKKIAPPKIVSEFADMFDIDGFEQPEEDRSGPQSGNMEVRLFEQVPMSNLQAVLPKSKLVFRPADAFIFDTISLATLAIVLGSIRFDSARLDWLAVVSVSLWLLRTVFRYSNKLARYDLLVKTFLTTKISQRNNGAFQYLSYEAASQRALRAALVYRWMLEVYQSKQRSKLTKRMLERNCETQVNELLKTDTEIQIDVQRAFQDLEELNLVSFSQTDGQILSVKDLESSSDTVKELWIDLLENERTFGDSSRSAMTIKNSPKKTENVVTEPDLDILDMLEEIDAAAANVQKLRTTDWKERRKVLANAIEEKKDASIAKAMAALEAKKKENIAKAKATLKEKKTESMQRAKAVLEESKDRSIQKAKAVLEERGGKAREFLLDKRNKTRVKEQSREDGDPEEDDGYDN